MLQEQQHTLGHIPPTLSLLLRRSQGRHQQGALGPSLSSHLTSSTPCNMGTQASMGALGRQRQQQQGRPLTS
jgi:hypothetical protein